MQKKSQFLFSVIALHIIFIGAPIAAINIVSAGLAASSSVTWITVALFCIGWVVILSWNRNTIGRFELRLGLKQDWKAAAGTLGALLIAAGIGRLIDPSFDTLYASHYGITSIIGVASFLAVLPPLLLNEELYTRTMQRLVSSRVPSHVAIILVALNFALLHISMQWPGHTASILVSVFLAAGVLTTFFAVTGNLLLSYILHVVYDVAVTIQIYLHATGNRTGESIFWILAAVVAILTFRYFKAIVSEQLRNTNERFSKMKVLWIGVALVLLPLMLRLM